MKSPGVYVYRPILDYDSTCYAKFSLYKNIYPIVKLDADFCDKMDQASGCKLPFSLKVNILKLIDRHSFNSGLTVNMDLTSLANIPAEIKKLFAKLLNHVYDVDHRTRDLVIDLMKTIAEADPSEAEDLSPKSSLLLHLLLKMQFTLLVLVISDSPTVNHTRDKKMRTVQPIPNNPNTIDVDKIMNFFSKSVAANVSISNPLSDISNVVKNASGSLKRGSVKISNGVENDVIPIEVISDVAPNSLSPSTRNHRSCFNVPKDSPDYYNSSSAKSPEDELIMETLPFSQVEVTPKLSKKASIISASRQLVHIDNIILRPEILPLVDNLLKHPNEANGED
ncbi:hypothetical protein C2845_PM17G05040 [Panicum miliaceum]|uniref:Uncharacterized protein n=1 Tax=Panicum miliaceum TaxID=4540 RepID=A0A3L6Q1K0_PANMI|nr:hypothetical protein C2845_PM17G05040 [Panicum miliaceum]